MAFREIAVEDLKLNPFTMIDKEWMLVTAGDEEKHNTMTASWGAMGIMWNKNIVTVYIRPQRYTREFMDANDKFTVSFYEESYRKALTLCGTKSGRDCDKEAEAGLTPYYVDETTAFEEARMIMVCKKQYRQEMLPECFTANENDAKFYPDKDYHILYMGEVEKVLVKED